MTTTSGLLGSSLRPRPCVLCGGVGSRGYLLKVRVRLQTLLVSLHKGCLDGCGSMVLSTVRR